MKKLIFIALLLFSINMVFADTTNIDQITETERIIDKYGEKIVGSFNNMTEKMSPYLNEGFEIIVKLEIAKGILGIASVLLPILFWILFLIEYSRIDNISEYGRPTSERNATVQLIIYLVASVVSTIISVFEFPIGIQRIIAPEWFAIKEIISAFSN